MNPFSPPVNKIQSFMSAAHRRFRESDRLIVSMIRIDDKERKSMSRKFSLAYLTIPGICPQDQIRIAAEAGYDFVSLRTIPMYLPGEPEYLMDRDPQLFKETKAALEHYNMKLMDIELARVREDLDIADFEKAFEKADYSLYISKSIGKNRYYIFSEKDEIPFMNKTKKFMKSEI